MRLRIPSDAQGNGIARESSSSPQRCAGEWTRHKKPCDNMRLRVPSDAQGNGIALNHVTICIHFRNILYIHTYLDFAIKGSKGYVVA